ncbi:hypothetical protein J2045_001860 [Peteryoungia aggregata LMG 23059]|uniref:Uncharacterized protein n=1 Tax=Peteryoungia aggregata LMG 23059 TaxID=1368425 RepID=A0ABU0G684_9HYPH|nr:hypothetical protein [Peteryoungia aggregata LMG 23059]
MQLLEAICWASPSAVSGVSSAGFSTIVEPAASAGADFHEAMRRGKFHVVSAPATPTGSGCALDS